jgi:dTDP-4-dehydrorhamnose 3,5-epimerase
MRFIETKLQDAWLVELDPRGDERGSFARSFSRYEFAERGLVADYIQANVSVSACQGTVRGLHFQKSPHTEAKLVRCVRGAILDVIVDLRGRSPTYLRHQAFELSASNKQQLYVPPGFAHGFQSLVDDIEITYMVSSRYTPSAEGGLRFNDPALGIVWPLPVSVISDKDARWPLIENKADSLF